MGRHDDYEDEFYDDEELLEEDSLALRERLRRKVVAVFGTSYGISLLVHGAVLLILASIVIAGAPAEREAKVLTNIERRIDPVDPEIKTALKKTPEIPIPDDNKVPRVNFDDPVVQEVPKGEPDNATDRNLERKSVETAIGVGATGGAGAWGDPRAARRASFMGRCGTPAYEAAPRAALDWLKRHQSPDGHWDADGWEGRCGRGGCKGPGHAQGMGGVDPGLTALSVLAFTGYGITHRHGEFKLTVEKARRWLCRLQRDDGSIGYAEGGQHAGMYNHAIATMALAELFGTTRDFTLRRPVQRAVDFCLKAQNPNLGWRYRVRSGANDTSVTGWMVLALKAARVAGIEVSDEVFAGAKRWFDRATNSAGEAGYTGPDGSSAVLPENDGKFEGVPTMTAVAVVCRIFTGERTTSESVRKGARQLATALPAWQTRRTNFYYWYYGTYAMYQVDGRAWKDWERAMLSALVPHQRNGGCEHGSWDPVGEWCAAGGRVYATAINALTLEIHYRYARQTAKG
ncbi:MAG: prenyltransferase/squalene oxidase repeat-containing protein [Planctomycetota bacterium]